MAGKPKPSLIHDRRVKPSGVSERKNAPKVGGAIRIAWDNRPALHDFVFRTRIEKYPPEDPIHGDYEAFQNRVKAALRVRHTDHIDFAKGNVGGLKRHLAMVSGPGEKSKPLLFVLNSKAVIDALEHFDKRMRPLS